MRAGDVMAFVLIAPEQLKVFWLIGVCFIVAAPFAIWWVSRGA